MKKLIKSGPGAGYDITVKGIELDNRNFKILKDEIDEKYGLRDVTVEVPVKPCVAEYWSAEAYYDAIDSKHEFFDSSEDSKIEGGKAVLFFTDINVDEGETIEDAIDRFMPSELNLTMTYGGGWIHANLPEDGIHFDDDNGRYYLDIGEVYDYKTISCDLVCPNICQDINAFFENPEEYYDDYVTNSRKVIKSANNYGWEVDSSEVPEALDLFVEYVGKETALEEIARAMGTDVLEENLDWVIRQWGFAEDVEDMDDVWEKFERAKEVMGADELYENLTQAAGHDELAEDLAFIFRQYDFREWDERKNNIDSGCHGKGKDKKKGKKEIKSAMDSRSLGDFSDDIIVRILEVESYDDRSPSVYDFFSEGDEMDLAEFKRSCKDLAEGQNGYFQVDDSSNQYRQIVNFASYDDEETMTGSVTFEVVLGLRNDALDDYLVASLKKEIKSMARQYIKPQYDARKSFYNKAETDDDKLYSYGTLVAEIVNGEPVLHDKWDYSATTIRHVKEWLQQNGFEAGTKQEIGRKYKKAEN